MKPAVNICMLLLLSIQSLFAEERQTRNVDPLKDTAVKTYKIIGEDVNLKLYVFSPPDHTVTDNRPAIVFFFGGGWRGGTPAQFAMQAEHLVSRGMVAICAEYRTRESHSTSPFECVMDAKSCIRWIRKHAGDLGVDSSRIAAAGGSAGGHLAAAAATVTGFDEDKDKSISCRPNALVLYNPVIDNGPQGYGYERVKDQYMQFSPIDNITEGLPPTLFMLGTKDQLIPVKTAEKFKALAEKVNARCDLKLYEGQKHGFFNHFKNKEMYYKTTRDLDIFLTSIGYLKGTVSGDKISPEAFANPPMQARPGAYWCWLNGVVDHKQMTREMEEAKALGMRGFEIWDVGAYGQGTKFVPAGPAFLGEESLKSIKHAMNEAKRLGLELNMIAASSWNAGGAWVRKDDGSKRMASSSLNVTGPKKFKGVLDLPCDEETYYYDVSVLAVPRSDDKKLASPDLGIDLTGHMDDTGELTWDVPEGNWTILRFVCRGTNQRLMVPSPNSDGLLIDHLSAEATERHMLHMIQKLEDVDPGHNILKIMSHDSYELDAANDWTEDFVDEFRKRRRYDPLKYLPLLEGWILADPDIQTRFLADYNKTVGELTVERHFRVSREVLNRYGMKLCAEAGHGGFPRVDPIWALGQADIPRGEFWNGKRFWVTKEAASAANLYGRRYVDSESFTGWRHWLDGPLHYKQLFDVAVCAGLNRLTFHTFTHNPPEAGLPGYVYHAGEHFNANNTWWKQSGPMLTYMARCSYMMQQGNFVADVCFYYGDQAPNLVPSRRIDPNIAPRYSLDKCLHCGRLVPIDFRPLGSGYDYDYIDAHSIIKRMTVDPETRQLVVGDMRYRVMVLPSHDHINLAVLQKICALVQEGAIILMPVQPVRTHSLTDYPQADLKTARIGKELRGTAPAAADTIPRSRSFGNGTVYTRGTSRQVLTEMGITPDFTVLKGGSQEGPQRIDSIHRRTDNADIYFVCNGAREAKSLLCRFRDAEGRPEIWYPVSGEIRSVRTVQRQPDNSCTLELDLPAIGSAFVVFRRDGQAPEKTGHLFVNKSAEKIPINGNWTVNFQPGRLAPESVEWNELIDWTHSEEPGIKYFSGTATYSIRFNLPEAAAGDFWLDLGKVCEAGEVKLDGWDLGTVWTYPFRVKVPAKLLAKGSHQLEVKVTNVWNNRLVGDQFLPEEERITRTNMQGQHTKQSPLVPSGLLGPVTLQPVKQN